MNGKIIIFRDDTFYEDDFSMARNMEGAKG